MKRVIKFRGLSPSGKWVYGYYVEREGYDKGIIYNKRGLGTDVDPKTVEQVKDMSVISIPISEVWELINKPHRFFGTVREEVEKILVGTDTEFIDWDAETKQDIINRLREFEMNGWRVLDTV